MGVRLPIMPSFRHIYLGHFLVFIPQLDREDIMLAIDTYVAYLLIGRLFSTVTLNFFYLQVLDV